MNQSRKPEKALNMAATTRERPSPFRWPKSSVYSRVITSYSIHYTKLYEVAEEFNQLTNELEVQQRIYNTLSPQFEAAKLSSEYEQIFQIFELAETPDEKSGPRRSVFVMMAFGGSFVGSSILAVLLSVLRAIRLKKKASF